MTKPMNFPGRKQERRVRALARMQVDLAQMEKVNANAKASHHIRYEDSMLQVLRAVIKNTERNIENPGSHFTKKACPAGRKNRKAAK